MWENQIHFIRLLSLTMSWRACALTQYAIQPCCSSITAMTGLLVVAGHPQPSKAEALARRGRDFENLRPAWLSSREEKQQHVRSGQPCAAGRKHCRRRKTRKAPWWAQALPGQSPSRLLFSATLQVNLGKHSHCCRQRSIHHSNRTQDLLSTLIFQLQSSSFWTISSKLVWKQADLRCSLVPSRSNFSAPPKASLQPRPSPNTAQKWPFLQHRRRLRQIPRASQQWSPHTCYQISRSCKASCALTKSFLPLWLSLASTSSYRSSGSTSGIHSTRLPTSRCWGADTSWADISSATLQGS